MKKILFLSFIIIIGMSVSAQQIKQPDPAVMKLYPIVKESNGYQMGIAAIQKKPQFNADGSVSPSSIELLIIGEQRMIKNPQTGQTELQSRFVQAPLMSIERGIGSSSIDWKTTFDRPAVMVRDDQTGQNTLCYIEPLYVVYQSFNGHCYITIGGTSSSGTGNSLL